MFPHSSQFYAELHTNIDIILEDSIVLHQYSSLDMIKCMKLCQCYYYYQYFSVNCCRESIGYRVSMQIDNDLNVHLLHHSIVSYFEHHTKYVSQDFSEFQEKEEQLTSKHNKKQTLLMSP